MIVTAVGDTTEFGKIARAKPVKRFIYSSTGKISPIGKAITALGTAAAIANELHLLAGEHIAVEANDITDLSDEECPFNFKR